ncbi:MAG: YceI family protein [Acidobacteriota bacterium]
MKNRKYFVILGLALILAISGFALALAAGSESLFVEVKPQTASKEAAPVASSGVYGFDPAHSTIGFSIRHLVINKIPGRFKDYKGTINFDSADITKSSVEFTAKVESIDTGVQARDNHLRTADFFEVAKYPELSFKSTRVVKKGKTDFLAIGTFTLKGVSKELTIPFKLNGPIKDPWGKLRIGIEANLTINRQDYGVSWSQKLDSGGLVVGNDVDIQLNIEAVKQ